MKRWLLVALVACKGDPERPPPPPRPQEPPVSPVDAGAVIDARTAPRGTKTVRGTLSLAKQRLANRPLELCPAGTLDPMAETFCQHAPWRLTTRTDADGGFVFTEVPDQRVTMVPLEAPFQSYISTVDFAKGSTATIDLVIPEIPRKVTPVTGRNKVRGTILHHERPVAGMALELCTAHTRSIKDETPCWDHPTRRTARTGPDGSFVFDGVVDGDLEIVMLEKPFYNRMVFALDVHGDRDLGTKRVITVDSHEFPHDDETADQWPDVRH